MDRKGFTLVELMVSIALVSLVLVFMFNLLSDIKRENALSNDNINDALNRATITRIIQNDWIEKKLTRVAKCSDSGTILCYNFTFKDGMTKKLLIKKQELEYDNERWVLEDGEYSKTGSIYCKLNGGIDTFLKIYIPVINHKEDNRIHDIELIKMGDNSLEIVGSNAC